jgi:hypothetical protein
MADNVNGWMDFAQRSRDDGGLGLAPHQAAGLVGNLQNESGSDLPAWGPTGDNGTAWGTAQWRNERLDGLKAHAQENGLDYRAPEAQQAWMRREFDTTHNGAYRALQAATTPEEAANVVNRQYEISADRSGHREAAARRLFDGSDGPTAIDAAMGRTRSPAGSQAMGFAATPDEDTPALRPQQPVGALTAGGSPVTGNSKWDALIALGQTFKDMAPGIAQDPDHAKALEASAAASRKVADNGTWSHITLPNGQIARINSKQGIPQVLNPQTGAWELATGKYKAPEKDPVQQAADVGRVKSFQEYADTISNNGATSRAALDAIAPVEAALANPNVPQGTGGDVRHAANKATLLLPGMDTPELRKTVADTDVARAGINKMVQEGRALNGGMPGSLSDRDVEFLKQEQASLSNTKEANARILDIYKRLHNRRIELDNSAQAYLADAEAHPLGLDNAFKRQVNQKWATENAARDKELAASPAATPAQTFKTPNGRSWSYN